MKDLGQYNLKGTHQLIGEISTLLMQSSLHCNMPLRDIRDYLLPAISLQQFRIYHKGDAPVAYISWAKLSSEIHEKYLYNEYSLRPDDWATGEQMVFVDFVAPFGHIGDVKHDLEQQFKGKTARYLRVGRDGKVKKIVTVGKRG